MRDRGDLEGAAVHIPVHVFQLAGISGAEGIDLFPCRLRRAFRRLAGFFVRRPRLLFQRLYLARRNPLRRGRQRGQHGLFLRLDEDFQVRLKVAFGDQKRIHVPAGCHQVQIRAGLFFLRLDVSEVVRPVDDPVLFVAANEVHDLLGFGQHKDSGVADPRVDFRELLIPVLQRAGNKPRLQRDSGFRFRFRCFACDQGTTGEEGKDDDLLSVIHIAPLRWLGFSAA